MGWRLSLVLLLILCAVTLIPLAHALPPDPTWVPGLYDDGDADAARILANSMLVVADLPPPGLGESAFVAFWWLPTQQAHGSNHSFRSTYQGRAPPIA